MNEITIIMPDWFMWMITLWFILYIIENCLKIALGVLTWWIGREITKKSV